MNQDNLSQKLLSYILEQEFAKNDLSDEEMNLIQKYISNDISDEEQDLYNKYVQENERFKITANVINYELNRKRPRYFLFRLLFSYQLFIDNIISYFSNLLKKIDIGFDTELKPIPLIAKPSYQLLSLKYSSPIIGVASIGLVIFMLQPINYSFDSLSKPQRFVYINNQWRGTEETQATMDLTDLIPIIRNDGESLIIDWKQTNKNADKYKISINSEIHFSDSNSIIINDFEFNNDTLSIEITDFYNKEPISRLKISYMISD